MDKIFKINKVTAFIIYIILDMFLVGMGMGVPFFCILFGFPVGWYFSKRLTLSMMNSNLILSKILKYGFITSFITFILMILIWGPFITMLLDPNTNFKNFGIPMILYSPKLSFIGWIILMILISPFLQLLTSIFASNMTLWRLNKTKYKISLN